MTLDPTREDLTIGIIGAGAMGRGIAQVSATGGLSVKLFDADTAAAEDARHFIGKMIHRLAEKGKLTDQEAESAANRVETVNKLEALSECHLIVEAIVEDLDVKKSVFRDLEAIVDDTCILATNTSSLSVTAIAAACKKPERVAGLHFFNPVPLMKLVEVVGGVMTEHWVIDALIAIGERMGRVPVAASDTPGFIVNHAGRGYGTEALQVVKENVADIADIDRIMTEAAGFRMGPFQLLDLTALDVSHPVMDSLYHQYYQEPRFRPTPLTKTRMDAGLYGKKVGRGFYDYEDGQAQIPPDHPTPDLQPQSVWISPADPAAREALAEIVRKAEIPLEEGPTASRNALCLIAPLGQDATSFCVEHGLDPKRTVAVDTLFGLSGRRTIMTTPLTPKEIAEQAHGLMGADGTSVSVIADSTGFVAQRIIANVINVAADMAQQQIAAPADIDKAVKLGLGYPKGPLEWCDELGAEKILTILNNIHSLSGDPRYRPSPWLRRRAQLGISLLSQS